jgi:glycosyltransferase 2 family protein
MKHLRIFFFIIVVLLAGRVISSELPSFQEAHILFSNINYFWVGMALLFQLGQYLGDGMLSKYLLSSIGIHTNLEKTSRIAAMNVFAAHVLPIGQAGAFATSYFFYRKLHIPHRAIIFLSLAWGIITNIILISLCLLALASLPNIRFPEATSRQFIYTAIFLGTIAVVILTSRFHIKKYIDKFKRGKQVKDFLEAMHTYQKISITNKKDLLLATLGGFIYFFSNIFTLSSSFLAFGQPIPFNLSNLAFTFSSIISMITLAPAGIGATEATMVLIFKNAGGIDTSIYLAAILLFRLITFWLPIPFGLLAYYSLDKSLKAKSQ